MILTELVAQLFHLQQGRSAFIVNLSMLLHSVHDVQHRSFVKNNPGIGDVWRGARGKSGRSLSGANLLLVA